MKFSCYKQDLVDALSFVMRAVAVKPMTPILASVYIKTIDTGIELQGNNFSTGIIAKIPAHVEHHGEAAVSGIRFQNFVRNMLDDTLTINDEDGNGLSIQSGGATVELLTMAAVDFPKVKTPDAECTFKIRATTLHDLIRKTVFAVAKDESRPIFTGCAFEVSGDSIAIVATNTHRLALAKDKLAEGVDRDVNFVVPGETLRGLLTKINPTADELITVSYSTRNVTFQFGDVFVNARLIEGIFPPYDRVIPKESTTRVNVDAKEFKSAVDLISLMSRETEYNTVKFLFEDGNVEISADSSDVGGAAKNVEAKVDGDDLSIAFNVSYITDVLRVLDAPRIDMAFNDKNDPAMIGVNGDENYTYVVTPVRTQ